MIDSVRPLKRYEVGDKVWFLVYTSLKKGTITGIATFTHHDDIVFKIRRGFRTTFVPKSYIKAKVI